MNRKIAIKKYSAIAEKLINEIEGLSDSKLLEFYKKFYIEIGRKVKEGEVIEFFEETAITLIALEIDSRSKELQKKAHDMIEDIEKELDL